ncbi:MAG: hypothetical protein OXG72_07795 [Acidobacteria bacterium]|nr:hypothetical protein [Acidobacteriota bacterium]
MSRDRLLDELRDARWKLVDASLTARGEDRWNFAERINVTMMDVHTLILAVQEIREEEEET